MASPTISSIPSVPSVPSIKEQLRENARELGFDRVGFCRADEPLEDPAVLQSWLEEGRHGRMKYLERNARRRTDARSLLPDARTIVVVALRYQANRDDKSKGVAAYARLADYHREIATRLESLLVFAQSLNSDTTGTVCVDTKPLLERRAARNAGVGWVGKNTMIMDVDHGPWLMLGELILSLDLEADEPEQNRCGTCTRCMDACPTRAFIEPYVLDATRCLSYWSIEHRGPWPAWIREENGTRLFGCDDCLLACPFGSARSAASSHALPRAPELDGLDPPETLRRLEDGFNRNFKHLAISRAGKAGLLRNSLTAIGNDRRRMHASLVAEYLDHVDVGVRIHAAWALGRTGRAADAPRLRSAIDTESDVLVRRELAAAWLELLAREGDAAQAG